MYTRRWLVFGALVAVMPAAKEPQASIQVTGAVKQALTLTPDDLAKMPRTSMRIKGNGMEIVYEGVWLHEVLNKAGVLQVANWAVSSRRLRVVGAGRFRLIAAKDKPGTFSSHVDEA